MEIDQEVRRSSDKLRLSILLVLFLSFYSSVGQFIEYGGGLGATSYAGDLSRGYQPLDSRFSVYGFYRLNFSEFVSFRTSLTYGRLTGDDSNPIDPLAEERNQSFQANLFELAGTFEYYFLDFRDEQSPIRWSPYLFAGFGITRFSAENIPNEDFSRTQAVLPFGVGIKQLIGKQFAVALEFGPRKTFTDHLDGVSGGEQTVKDFNFGQPNTDDWYFHAGISVAYILYKIPCPFPYIPNQSMFRR